MTEVVDLRSDTVTRPTPAMRRAIAEAVVGDDVFGEDPSVNRLEEMAAEIAGKEAAVFVPSGTMANQLAIRTQTRPGDEILLEQGTHPFNFEAGAPAVLSAAARGADCRSRVGVRSGTGGHPTSRSSNPPPLGTTRTPSLLRGCLQHVDTDGGRART